MSADREAARTAATPRAERTLPARFEGSAGADDWDPRVYAISPGSAELLRSIGAWQRLPVDRLAPIETMEVRGDADGAIAVQDTGEHGDALFGEGVGSASQTAPT